MAVDCVENFLQLFLSTSPLRLLFNFWLGVCSSGVVLGGAAKIKNHFFSTLLTMVFTSSTPQIFNIGIR